MRITCLLQSRTHKQTGADNRSCWKHACMSTQSQTESRRRHPIDALRPVLAAFFSWSTSSSGVELFSKAERNHLERGSRATGSDSERRSYIALSSNSNGTGNDKELIPAVQALYMSGRGPARAHVRPRLDQGIKRRQVQKQVQKHLHLKPHG